MSKIQVLILTMLFSVSVLLCGCDTLDLPAENTGETIAETSADTDGGVTVTTNEGLYEHFINSWQNGSAASLYDYVGDEIAGLIGAEDFAYSLDYYTRVGGALTGAELTGSATQDGVDTFTSAVSFEHSDAEFTLLVKDLKIAGYSINVHFRGVYERDAGGGVTERYFSLENDGYSLNAVYTYINDGGKHPTALIIGGSGHVDYNETVGLLTPAGDLASALAESGVNTLRLDKRTLNYGASLKVTDGLEQEYFSDCRAALDYLRAQDSAGDIYLIGHSLGAQIAAALAAEQSDINGMVLFNGSARHLAAIACDQYAGTDPDNRSSYENARDAAMAATADNASGASYYGASDYYWATYNKLDTIESIKTAGVPVLIINSTADKQSFDADIELWQTALGGDDNVEIYIDDKISHFGYEIDASDQTAFGRRVPFPTRITDKIAEFIKKA